MLPDSSAQVGASTERFSAAYRELSPRVLGYLRSHGVDDPEAVTDDVFLALHRRFGSIDGGDNGVRTLTFSIAHARLVDSHRARARRPMHVPFDAEDDPRRSASAEDDAIDAVGGGATALLTRLGDDQRQVVSLRVIAGLSLEETAQVMDRSVGSIKQLQRRGLESLRSLLAQEAIDV
ncbi:MAG TPA: RNA polymerase sigma factor [Pseudolysinimonas sp.]|nr:RNA polymerase sigma factor [Pseudolysinimonas sp.]